MKYIRTKDGIYELNPPDYESPMCLDGKTITTCVYTKNQEWVAKSDILKQSNNYKELCDYFFHLVYNVDTDSYEINYWGKAEKLNEYLKDYKRDLMFGIGIGEDKVLLAILTDKGLIFVAKMNEKGDLELI